MVARTVVRVDERGRIVIPKELRSKIGIRGGDLLEIEVRGDDIIIRKVEDPLRVLEEVLGGLTFSRELRRVADTAAREEVG